MAKCKRCSSSWKHLFLLFFLVSLPLQLSAATDKPRELVLLNWADYMDPELIGEFEKKFNARVLTPYFESDDHRTRMLAQSGGKNYDLVIVDTPSISTYAKAGWLAKIDTDKTPNLQHIKAEWKNHAYMASDYSVPFSWGTLGIAYREDLVSKIPDSWMDLFQPDETLHGKIAMYRNTIDLIGAALKALGYSINSTDPEALKKVKKLLLEQQPFVRTYDYLSLSEDSALVTGEVIASMFYSSDTVLLQEFNDNIKYVVPKEGSALWVDSIVVLKNSKNKDLVWQFIDFINQPEHAARLAQFIYGPTPNKAAEVLLPEEFVGNPVIYPDATTLSKSEFNKPLPARIIRLRNDIITLIPK